ncbi:MAG TPA: NYN domain-containing protein, partial [Vicinamibacterales bacterium]|nr:NYN domain-containing protein [Vicinamibacterales bacterium]
MSVTEPRSTRIAVFIDFDNVEIGVKTTIGAPFDIGLVLEAIKERGEIVTKVAYSDWKRAGDYSRLLTQHAIRMVQRNVTPGGDKNGADITMALDALEMAFTHDHINAFVIVGGDSDFISLVEKLKQYGKKVIVVGGRQFTSVTMQKNCHEFIAYENLIGGRGGRAPDRGGRATSDISKALPIVRRALKVLSEREVAPQLGLLKSTLLQLDSTFSEREYGASSFRDFMEKVAQTGAVTLKHAGRSMLVELREDGGGDVEAAAAERAPAAAPPADIEADEEEALPRSPMTMQDGIRAVQQAFSQASPPPRWPLYVRQAKQFLKNAMPGFDERNYGFASVVDLLRAAGKEGVLRIERDRHGAVRVFPGSNLAVKPVQPPGEAPVDLDETVDVSVPPERVTEIVDAEPVDTPPPAEAAGEAPAPEPEPVIEVTAEPPPAQAGAEP